MKCKWYICPVAPEHFEKRRDYQGMGARSYGFGTNPHSNSNPPPKDLDEGSVGGGGVNRDFLKRGRGGVWPGRPPWFRCPCICLCKVLIRTATKDTEAVAHSNLTIITTYNVPLMILLVCSSDMPS